MKELDAYVKTIESYGGRKPIHTGFVKVKLTDMVVQETNKPTLEEKDKAEGKSKEGYFSCLMMYGTDNSHFATIKTDLENNMTCGSDSYTITKN